MNKIKQLPTIRLADKQIAEYQKIYQQTFGKTISKDEALVQGLSLARLVNVISQVDEDEKREHDDNTMATVAN